MTAQDQAGRVVTTELHDAAALPVDRPAVNRSLEEDEEEQMLADYSSKLARSRYTGPRIEQVSEGTWITFQTFDARPHQAATPLDEIRLMLVGEFAGPIECPWEATADDGLGRQHGSLRVGSAEPVDVVSLIAGDERTDSESQRSDEHIVAPRLLIVGRAANNLSRSTT